MIGFSQIHDISLPFHNPVIVISVLMFVMLIVPLLFSKMKIPHIIGYIFAGMLIGPHGLNILARDSSIVLFGTVGILYVMFLAGLELEISDFKKNKEKSIVFGLLTFLFPLVIGFTVSFYLLEYSFLPALLIASIYSTQTLVAYPIVAKFDVAKARSVNIVLGGTLITDTLAILVLAFVINLHSGTGGISFIYEILLLLILLCIIVLYVFPKITVWFLRKFENNISQFTFILGVVFLSSFFSEIIGLEAIIGAFLAGLAMNKIIPKVSPIMNRLEFVGNAIFIPFFLIGVGMIINLSAVVSSYKSILLALIMVVIATSSKWLAAFFTQKIFGYSKIERRMIFGLSNAHAAVALATVLIGFNFNLFGEEVLNGTILVILFSCIISSFSVENAAKQIALTQKAEKVQLEDEDRVLIPLGNPDTVDFLVDLAVLTKEKNKKTPLFLLSVINDSANYNKKLVEANSIMEKAAGRASATDTKVQPIARLDLNISNGIINSILENFITEIILGWNPRKDIGTFLFGTISGSLLTRTNQAIMILKYIKPFREINRLTVFVPEYADFEFGFNKWILKLNRLAANISAEVIYIATPKVLRKIAETTSIIKTKAPFNSIEFSDWNNHEKQYGEVRENDLLVCVSSRKLSVSYNPVFHKLPAELEKQFPSHSLLIVFPEQKGIIDEEITIPSN